MIDVTVLDLLLLEDAGFPAGAQPTHGRAAAAALLLLLQGKAVSKTAVMARMGLSENSTWFAPSHDHDERWATVEKTCKWHQEITGAVDVTTATQNDLNKAHTTIGELRATIETLEARLEANDEVLTQLLDVARGPLNDTATRRGSVTPDDNVTEIRQEFFYEDDGTGPPPARAPHLRPVPDLDRSHTEDPYDDGSFAIWDAETDAEQDTEEEF